MAKVFPLNMRGFNPFCDLIGLRFTSVSDGISRCTVKITSQTLNPHGVVHGGVIYTMADTGMGAALYSCIDADQVCSTVQLNIHYFEAVSSGILICKTKIVRRSKKLATLESEVKCGRTLVAKASGTYYISHISK